MKKMRKGFTLIELLVVISVIGAIAAMMAISSGEAMTSAKAGNIINNLRNIATAANEYYFDHMSELYKADAKDAKLSQAEIKLYMNEGVSETTDTPESKLDNYYIVNADATGKSVAEVDWYVGYKFPATGEVGYAEGRAIKVKLAGRAKNVGLYGSADEKTAPVNATGKNAPAAYASEAVVWMRVREASRRTTATAATDPVTPSTDPVTP